MRSDPAAREAPGTRRVAQIKNYAQAASGCRLAEPSISGLAWSAYEVLGIQLSVQCMMRAFQGGYRELASRSLLNCGMNLKNLLDQSFGQNF